MYGVDVALVRADDLDKKVLAYVQKSPDDSYSKTVLELGCGAGGQSVRLAAAGATVTAVDIVLPAVLPAHTNLFFLQGDIRNLATLLSGVHFDAVLIQRTIHYLRYEEAYTLLTYLRSVSKSLYISVTGLESDIGERYAAASTAVTERFAKLPVEDRGTFSIHEPVCLYTPEEFIVLLQKSGWEIDECWVSAFGNIKVVCS